VVGVAQVVQPGEGELFEVVFGDGHNSRRLSGAKL
jgi:hypothetical protein